MRNLLAAQARFVDLEQGSQQWLQWRKEHLPASELPAACGTSPYTAREVYLHEKATGEFKPVDEQTARIFKRGHEIEEAARPIVALSASILLGRELSFQPLVAECGQLSASFDGITPDRSMLFECKTLNDTLREALPLPGQNIDPKLPLHYRLQMSQQWLVASRLPDAPAGGPEAVIFCAATTNPDDTVETRWCLFTPSLVEIAMVCIGWNLFLDDLGCYVPFVGLAELEKSLMAKKIELPQAITDLAATNVGGLIFTEGTVKVTVKSEGLVSLIEQARQLLAEGGDDTARLKAIAKKVAEAEKELKSGIDAMLSPEQAQAWKSLQDLIQSLRTSRLDAEHDVKERETAAQLATCEPALARMLTQLQKSCTARLNELGNDKLGKALSDAGYKEENFFGLGIITDDSKQALLDGYIASIKNKRSESGVQNALVSTTIERLAEFEVLAAERLLQVQEMFNAGYPVKAALVLAQHGQAADFLAGFKN